VVSPLFPTRIYPPVDRATVISYSTLIERRHSLGPIESVRSCREIYVSALQNNHGSNDPTSCHNLQVPIPFSIRNNTFRM
jgi:hypothetical protein